MALKALTDATTGLTAAVTALSAKFTGEIITAEQLQPVTDAITQATAAINALVNPPTA